MLLDDDAILMLWCYDATSHCHRFCFFRREHRRVRGQRHHLVFDKFDTNSAIFAGSGLRVAQGCLSIMVVSHISTQFPLFNPCKDFGPSPLLKNIPKKPRDICTFLVGFSSFQRVKIKRNTACRASDSVPHSDVGHFL